MAGWACFWAVAVCTCRYLPDGCFPRWYAARRKGPEALRLYGDMHKPATMTVSLTAGSTVSQLANHRRVFRADAAAAWHQNTRSS